METIKEFKVLNYGSTVCHYLMLHKVAFSFCEEDGLIFAAPEYFVEKMTYALRVAYGCKKINIIEFSK